ncbi:expressed unknown protein [Seminavis robusta]|uniref:Uncharacterized protein n=1 Tax=Seminavis robusta TaxID=568900 RepID=A0A9N8DEY7_9STRA|nr:expressed unknown protein [Seminavis robusta]|eukprot:Sro109_g054440.1 n/a (279) ;mRNA; f:21654-22490
MVSSSATPATSNATASKKRPRDKSDESSIGARETPEKKAKEGHKKDIPGASPEPRIVEEKGTSSKTVGTIKTPPGGLQPSKSNTTKGNQANGGSVDRINILGSPPSLILSSEKLAESQSSQSSTENLLPVCIYSSSSPLPAIQTVEQESSVENISDEKTAQTTNEANGSSSVLSWVSGLVVLVSLILFYATSITTGFWLAEKLDRELDALDYQSSVKSLETKLKTQQIEHHNDMEQWKAKVGLVQQELKGFQQECSSLFEQLERQHLSEEEAEKEEPN